MINSANIKNTNMLEGPTKNSMNFCFFECDSCKIVVEMVRIGMGI